jgi:hypothetical protein
VSHARSGLVRTVLTGFAGHGASAPWAGDLTRWDAVQTSKSFFVSCFRDCLFPFPSRRSSRDRRRSFLTVEGVPIATWPEQRPLPSATTQRSSAARVNPATRHATGPRLDQLDPEDSALSRPSLVVVAYVRSLPLIAHLRTVGRPFLPSKPDVVRHIDFHLRGLSVRTPISSHDDEPKDVDVLLGLGKPGSSRPRATGNSGLDHDAAQCRPQHLPIVAAVPARRWDEPGGQHLAHSPTGRTGWQCWRHNRSGSRCSCMGTCSSTS